MKKVLIAYDGSVGAEAALAALSTEEGQLEVLVLNVAEVWILSGGTADLDNETLLPEEIRQSRQRALDAVQAQGEIAAHGAEQLQVAHPTWNIKAVVSTGPPAQVIVRMAEEWQADLIMLGSQKHSALRRLLFRSITRSIVRTAPCSVEIVKMSDRLRADSWRWRLLSRNLGHAIMPA